jgi:hypothetical protein
MRAAAFLGLALAGCTTCQATPPSTTPASAAWNALVGARCAAQDIAGPLYVAEQLDAGAPPYLVCLSQGAHVVSCGDGGDPVVTPCALDGGAP